MAFCGNCGSPVQGKFCGKCGAPAPAGPPAAQPPAGAPSQPPPAFGGQPPQSAYGAAPPPQQAYGAPPAQPPAYGGQPPQYGYGAPPPPGFGAQPPQQPGYGAPPPAYGAPPQAGYQPGSGYPPPATAGGMTDNVAGMLCYLPFAGWLWSIICLVIDPYKRNRAVRFHAFQSLFLTVALFALNIVFNILFRILLHILSVFGLLSLIIWPVFWLAILGLQAYLMYQTYSNQKVVLPVIGGFAEGQA